MQLQAAEVGSQVMHGDVERAHALDRSGYVTARDSRMGQCR